MASPSLGKSFGWRPATYLCPVAFARYPKIVFVLLLSLPLLFSCTAEAESGNKKAENSFPETFEDSDKRAYVSGDVALSTGLWQLNGSLIGNSTQDAKDGSASLRLKGGGGARMLFDIRGEVKAIRVKYAMFGNDKRAAISIWYSVDGGAHWVRTGSAVHVSGNEFETATFTLHQKGPVRFDLRNEGPQRANLDDFEIIMADGSAAVGQVSQGNGAPTRDDNLALGNPSEADSDALHTNNYLVVRPQYALSYNNEKGRANWVSWHLSMAWRGTAIRCNCFDSDSSLPTPLFRASGADYNGGGLDRGHLCPSEDRTGSPEDNAATFLMSNIAPQAHELNQQAWQDLELYARTLSAQGNELYIIAGSYGRGGENKKGVVVNSIAHGRIEVPARFWKIMIVLPVGNNDITRISKDTRVIAVDMPNEQVNQKQSWGHYRCSVKSIEDATGYRFLKKIPKEIAVSLSGRVDR